MLSKCWLTKPTATATVLLSYQIRPSGFPSPGRTRDLSALLAHGLISELATHSPNSRAREIQVHLKTITIYSISKFEE